MYLILMAAVAIRDQNKEDDKFFPEILMLIPGNIY